MRIGFGQQILYETLFWIHFGIILAGLLMGLVFPLWLVVFVVAVHRLHLRMMGDCAVSRLQARMGGLEYGESYLQDLSRRFFDCHITEAQVKKIDRAIVGSSIAVAIVCTVAGGQVIVSLTIAATALFGLKRCIKLYNGKKASNQGVCMVGGGCGAVAQSNFSSIGRVPIEALGGIYFCLIIVLLIASGIFSLQPLYAALQVLLVAGFLSSLGFIFLQLGVLKNICQQCNNIHIASLTIAILSFLPLY